jgi:NADPH-dependent 7-cyano-7-deazaguanine reductase QueF
MSEVVTIPNSSQVQLITYTPSFSTICSVGKAPFWGNIAITYKPEQKLLEFEAFEVWLFSLATQQMTIEDLCRLVFNKLTEVLGDIPLAVTVNAMTTVHAPASATIKQGDF